MINWREYYTDGQMLQQLSQLTGEPIQSRYHTDNDITSDLNRLIRKHSDVFNEIVSDLEQCEINY